MLGTLFRQAFVEAGRLSVRLLHGRPDRHRLPRACCRTRTPIPDASTRSACGVSGNLCRCGAYAAHLPLSGQRPRPTCKKEIAQ